MNTKNNMVSRVSSAYAAKAEKARRDAIDEKARKDAVPKLERRNPKAVPLDEYYAEVEAASRGEAPSRQERRKNAWQSSKDPVTFAANVVDGAVEGLEYLAPKGKVAGVKPFVPERMDRARQRSYDHTRAAVAGYVAEKNGKSSVDRKDIVGTRFAKQHPGLVDSDVIVEAPRRKLNKELKRLSDIEIPNLNGVEPVYSQGVATDALVDNLERGYVTWPSMSIVDKNRPVGVGYDAKLGLRNMWKQDKDRAGYAAISYRDSAIPKTVKDGNVTTTNDSFSPSSSTVLAELARGKTKEDILKNWYLSPYATVLRQQYDFDQKTGELSPKGGTVPLEASDIIRGTPETKITKDLPFTGRTIKAAFISGRGYSLGVPEITMGGIQNENGAVSGVKILKHVNPSGPYLKAAEALNAAEIPFSVEKDIDVPANLPKHTQYETMPKESILMRRIWSHGLDSLRQDAKGGEARSDSKGGDSGDETQAEVPVQEPSQEVPAGGPRIVINPTTFRNRKDALCVAFNERFRIAMEQYGWDPRAEPTDAQREFFSDTAYADDEVMLRRTIAARILTLDTSVKDPTDDQISESLGFLAEFRKRETPSDEWEASAVERIARLVETVVAGTGTGSPASGEVVGEMGVSGKQ